MCTKQCCDCCACFHNWQARAIWFPIMMAILATVAILLAFPGYVDNNKWNENAVETKCVVISHSFADMGCRGCAYYESCNCVTDCSSGACKQSCQSCIVFYQYGYITVRYDDNYTKTVEIIARYTYNDAVNYLNSNYPINTTVPGYYQRDDPTNFKLFKDPVIGYLIGCFSVVALCCALAVLWAVLDIVRCAKKGCNLKN